MKEKPILFNTPMVRAILEGRKTQTRRAYKNRKHQDFGCGIAASELAREQQHVIDRICPFGQPGDRLWVRETAIISPPNWCERHLSSHPDAPDGPRVVQYLASEPCREAADDYGLKTTPSIHMPRWASRITLEIIAIRVERLNDISEADAKAEGADCLITKNCTEEERRLLDLPLMDDATPYRNGFALLWESLAGSGSWAANPWVWVIEFRRI